MPNHVKNILNICTEDIEKYREIREFIKGENGIIDFGKIVPQPEILNESQRTDEAWIAEALIKRRSGKSLMNIENVRADRYKTLSKDRKKIVNEYIARFNACKYVDWYQFRCVEWGTKWNAYEIVPDESFGEEQHLIEFNTAWATPEPVICALSKIFPDVTFEVRFADEDMGYNCGTYAYHNGECEDTCPEAGSDEAIRFACDVWGYDYDEYMSELEEATATE